MVERGDVFRELLQHALTVTVALVGQRQDEEMRTLTVASLAQNEEVKRISAWAAILFAPHPDRHHPRHELRHHARAAPAAGYPMAVFLMIAMGVALYQVFKRRRWL